MISSDMWDALRQLKDDALREGYTLVSVKLLSFGLSVELKVSAWRTWTIMFTSTFWGTTFTEQDRQEVEDYLSGVSKMYRFKSYFKNIKRNTR